MHELDWLKSGESSSAIIPPPPQFTDPADLPWDAGCSCTDACECVTGQSADTDDCDPDRDSDSESENEPPATTDLRSDSAGSLRSLGGGSHSASSDVTEPQCVFGLDDPNLPEAAADVLRGRVVQMTKTAASPLLKALIRQTLSEWRSSRRLHEGLIFHQVRRRQTAPSVRSGRLCSLAEFLL